MTLWTDQTSTLWITSTHSSPPSSLWSTLTMLSTKSDQRFGKHIVFVLFTLLFEKGTNTYTDNIVGKIRSEIWQKFQQFTGWWGIAYSSYWFSFIDLTPLVQLAEWRYILFLLHCKCNWLNPSGSDAGSWLSRICCVIHWLYDAGGWMMRFCFNFTDLAPLMQLARWIGIVFIVLPLIQPFWIGYTRQLFHWLNPSSAHVWMVRTEILCLFHWLNPPWCRQLDSDNLFRTILLRWLDNKILFLSFYFNFNDFTLPVHMAGWQDILDIHCCIAANPPGFPRNLLDFEICSGIPDLNKNSRILKFVQKTKQKTQKLGSFLTLCQGLR